jgi:hypothetical protein
MYFIVCYFIFIVLCYKTLMFCKDHTVRRVVAEERGYHFAQAAGVAWWSSLLTPAREGARSIPNPGTPFPTLGIGASPLFQDLASRFFLILNMA